MKNSYLANAFSLQMLTAPCGVQVQEISPQEIPVDCVSCVGHEDTARVLSGILGRDVPAARVNIHLDVGDSLYVAQLTGGRLPEGATTLPEGFCIRFFKVEVTEAQA